MNDFIRRVQKEFNDDWGLAALRAAIIVVALAFIAVALLVQNKWILAGALAYIVLP